ncbi:CHASE2 domain-containing protein [Massilia arenae]|uniref:Adenylate/guanylate cyclase domain-containing protein n=1 Tax=Massilia arenae TaxID=2603288 RepID=A0A5C7G1X0_9BURK|nr:adenylate/guanylate cyclase domain-containing protein [Massilia arenae]TXF97920.1 adenylate/guanylate cyclase domain-containing protein [Massilia arenae]
MVTLWSQYAIVAPLSLADNIWTRTVLNQVSFLPNEWLRDAFLRLQVSDDPEPRILVVDIDEASLAELGPWPWPRERLAHLVEILLADYAARGVALDIVLPSNSDDDAGDDRLALLAAHGPLVPAQAFDFDFAGNRPQPVRDGNLGGASTRYRDGVPATGYVGNYPALAAAPHIGAIGFIPDPDGSLRRIPLVTQFAGKQYPALGLALLDCCSGKPALALPDDGMMRIPYRRDWRAYTVVSAADILAQRIVPSSASGRLVLVGSSSLGMGDRVSTPLAASRPGLGVQATILSALLDRQEGKLPAPWPGRLAACLFALASIAGCMLAFPRLSAAAGVALLGLSSALWLAIAYVLVRHDPDFAPIGPLATNLFLLAVAVPYQWHQAQRRSRHLLQTLRQYVAPAVVEQLLRSEEEDPLRPRQRDVTTLVADMEGYTTQVESLPVEEAARLTRDFLDCLTGQVIAHQGTLDKYTGDGMMAFWGAPLPLEQHADLALDAAHEMTRRVAALSAERVRQGYLPLRVRIGVESGNAMAGDFGTSFRSIYTAVGDSVNTAARLEQVARDFPHDIIIGPGTVSRSRRHRFLALGERLLRGKERATPLFTLDITNTDDVSDPQADGAPRDPAKGAP